MTLEKRSPCRVSELSRTFRGAHNVGEQHGCEDPIRLIRPGEVGQEALVLAHRLLVHVIVDPREESAQLRQLRDLARWDSRGDVVRLGA